MAEHRLFLAPAEQAGSDAPLEPGPGHELRLSQGATPERLLGELRRDGRVLYRDADFTVDCEQLEAELRSHPSSGTHVLLLDGSVKLLSRATTHRLASGPELVLEIPVEGRPGCALVGTFDAERLRHAQPPAPAIVSTNPGGNTPQGN